MTQTPEPLREDLALLDEIAQATPERAPLRVVCAADVEPESVRWLWPGWLPLGKLVAFDGAPGVGKSTLALDLIARATRGGPMPGCTETFPPVTVLLAGVEDGWSDTIVPRLMAANADLSRVQFVQSTAAGNPVTIPDDVLRLADAARECGATWLHIDAIMGTLSEHVKANDDHAVRRALGALKDEAERLGMLVTFVRHPRKAGGSAVNAGGGSIAFTALSRVTLFAGVDPTDTRDDVGARRRILAVGKNNLAKTPTSLTYNVVSGGNGAGCISWGESSAITADELAAPAPPVEAARTRGDRMPSAKSAATQFLERELAHGARVPVNELKARALSAGLSWSTVEKAKHHASASSERVGYQTGSVWFIPTVAKDDPFPPFAPPELRMEPRGGNGVNEEADPIPARWAQLDAIQPIIADAA